MRKSEELAFELYRQPLTEVEIRTRYTSRALKELKDGGLVKNVGKGRTPLYVLNGEGKSKVEQLALKLYGPT